MDLTPIWRLTPHAQMSYHQTFENAESVFDQFELHTDQRIVHFLAQVLHETSGFALLVENLNYSPERLMAVWPSKFPTLEVALPYARNPGALANRVYGKRLGNTEPNDGWMFRGRGLLQITGRANYQKVSNQLGVDLTAVPDKVLLPEYGLSVACCMWQALRCNEAADTDDVLTVTKRVNGGSTGLADRTAWLLKVRGALQ